MRKYLFDIFVLLTIAALAVLAAGCALPTGPTDMPGIGFAFRLEAAPDYTLGVTPRHQQLADQRWRELQQCLGVTWASRGFPMTLRRNEGGPMIAYFSSGGQAVGGKYYYFQGIEVLGDTEWVQSWKHEMMHYLLHMATGDPDDGHTRGGLVEYSPGRFMGRDWLACTVKDGPARAQDLPFNFMHRLD